MDVKRVTFSVPVDVVTDLDNLAKLMGCSRSAALTLSLRLFLSEIAELLKAAEGSPAEAARRMRGESAEDLAQEFEKFQSYLKGMDSSGQFHLGGLRDRL